MPASITWKIKKCHAKLRENFLIAAFLFQTNRDLRLKDPIPNRARREVKKIRMGENTNQTQLNRADEAIHPHTREKITKIRDQSQENLGEEALLV